MAKINQCRFYIVTDHQGINGKAMPKIVEAYILYTGPIDDGFEMLDNSSSFILFICLLFLCGRYEQSAR